MHSIAPRNVAGSAYRARLAETEQDLHAAQHLRFQVFNLEMEEGLASSWQTYRDADRFDEVCDHLLVEHLATGQIVGTYRLQTGSNAALNHGYYGEQEFDFSPFARVRSEIVELGRACVHCEHRRMPVVNLLWRGIAEYARQRGARYLVGCSSVPTQDSAVGWAFFERMAIESLAPEPFRTTPRPAFALEPLDASEASVGELPRLLRAYLSLGAKICGPPALDREFRTIDFLTFLDLNRLPVAVQSHFLA